MLYRDHKEFRPARQVRNAADLNTFVNWLKTHNPFNMQFNKNNKLCSVCSGVSADNTINCDPSSEE